MNKILIYLCLYFMTSITLAGKIVIYNKTNYPVKDNSRKIAVQWVATVEATQKANKIIVNGSKLDLNSLKIITQKGKTQLTLPNDSHYFRVVVWSTGKQQPDLLTNWVDIVPNKTYIINQDQLVPAILMSGTGC
ncbi:TPA: hypothetical protein I8Y89_000004 [Legionella pneumophila]|uniref:hypothetical protein n=1 Tax=Legionella pneumophila TaxID=446 RepID=UPI00077081A2|nr:hypothetical protein [Legionella pneumophila]MDW9175091.1 hypothetical protein [Legionella pneumophila]TIG87933.1 hypothetical protein DI110_02405 [Legionella pneumophila]CZF99149.1 Uncharacterised protein [Legionella pneumophila]STX83678.1 Uncharacterised protein [Legionella pneumophila]HAT1792015.1 hypothetical protein [Legionella pneumophila]